MIDTRQWKEFLLSDIFLIKKGKRLTKENQTEGDTIFIGATASNNGITAYIGQDAIHEGNTISLTYNGSVGEAFYQETDFWASDDVNVLYAKDFKMDKSIALFFCAVLRLEKQMWSYARKWNLAQMNKTKIKLPVKKDGNIDFDFMRAYVGSLNDDISDIPDYFLGEGYDKACWYMDNVDQKEFEDKYSKPAQKKKLELTDRKWAKFKIKDIVADIHNGKSYNASDLINAADGDDFISYVTRTDENNGVSIYAQVDEYAGLEDEGAITIGDTTATIFYQSNKFITGPHMIVVRADWFNVYTANFFITLLNLEKYRYPVFGRAFTKDLVMNTEIELPIDSSGNPDFEFMENYIKGMPFSCNL